MLTSWWDRWERGATINGHQTNRPTGGLHWLFADRTWEEDGAVLFDAYGRSAKDVSHFNLAEQVIKETKKYPNYATKLLEECLTVLAPPVDSLVYIDPIILFVKGNPNGLRDVAWTLMDIRQICQRLKITVIATHYYSKQKAGGTDQYARSIDRGSGSGGFVGFAHTVMYLEEPTKDQPYHLFGWRPRHAPEQTFPFTMNSSGMFEPYEGLVNESPKLEYDRPSQLFLLIPDEGIETGDLVEGAMAAFEISRDTVNEDLRILDKKRNLIDRSRHGWVYRRKTS
jgi:hypothetical protein